MGDGENPQERRDDDADCGQHQYGAPAELVSQKTENRDRHQPRRRGDSAQKLDGQIGKFQTDGIDLPGRKELTRYGLPEDGRARVDQKTAEIGIGRDRREKCPQAPRRSRSRRERFHRRLGRRLGLAQNQCQRDGRRADRQGEQDRKANLRIKASVLDRLIQKSARREWHQHGRQTRQHIASAEILTA